MRRIGGPVLLLGVFFLLLPRASFAVTQKGYTQSEAVALGDKLTAELGVATDQRVVVRERLTKWLAENRAPGTAPISGVLAYQMKEGGVIVSVTKGKGIVRYFGDERDRPLKLSGVTGGAQIGGSSQFGVGVILGADPAKNLSGKYRVTHLGTTQPEAKTNVAELAKKNAEPGQGDKLVLIGTAAGLSATAAAGDLKVTVK
jgi:hypothetical protein